MISFYAFSDELQKIAFAVSRYSGPLSMGRFKMESYIPPFRAPGLKTAGPPSEKVKKAYDPSPVGNVDLPGMRKMKTPARALQQAKAVGTVGETPPDAKKAFNVNFTF